MISARSLIKGMIHRSGFDVHRLNAYANPAYQLLVALKKFEVDLVADIGANVGQFSSDLRSVGYGGRIISFEPLSEAHALLTANAKGDKDWKIAPRCAIGDRDGEVSINVSGNSVSSSLLPMLESHSTAEAKSAYVRVETVPISRFDTLARTHLSGARRPFVKIDTQGFEWQVLDGMAETLPEVAGVLCELSLVPLYDGQRLWTDIISRLEKAGFTLWALQQGFTDLRNGRTLQLDGIFFRQ